MDQHISYEQIWKRPCDFIVKYRFLSEDEGGRKTGPPSQGYRSDFMYDGDSPKTDRIFMIHPEFLDEENNVIINKSHSQWSGKAKMWIINSDFIPFHKNRLKVGTKGFFMEGPTKTAECEVIEIIGFQNY
jgi:hypothetical protein